MQSVASHAFLQESNIGLVFEGKSCSGRSFVDKKKTENKKVRDIKEFYFSLTFLNLSLISLYPLA